MINTPPISVVTPGFTTRVDPDRSTNPLGGGFSVTSRSVDSLEAPRRRRDRLVMDRYMVIDLAHRGISQIHRARDVNDGAMRWLHVRHGEGGGDWRRVARRMKRLASVTHSAVPRVHDVRRIGSRPMMVTDCFDAPTLADRRFSLRTGRRIPVLLSFFDGWLPKIAEGLDRMHAAGIIHGHVRCETIKLSAEHGPILCPIGLFDPPAAREEADLAPETALHGTSVPATDQYALAVLVWECLAGVRPFGDRCDATHRAAQMHRAARGLSDIREYGGDAVVKVLSRALSVNPSGRFENCVHFVAALKKAFATGPRRPLQSPRSTFCPGCHGRIAVLPTMAGRSVQCKSCDGPLDIRADGTLGDGYLRHASLDRRTRTSRGGKRSVPAFNAPMCVNPTVTSVPEFAGPIAAFPFRWTRRWTGGVMVTLLLSALLSVNVMAPRMSSNRDPVLNQSPTLAPTRNKIHFGRNPSGPSINVHQRVANG